jgi:hypothetical protein
VGLNLGLKVVKKTTTYWGWLPPAESFQIVPGYATSKINPILKEIKIISTLFRLSKMPEGSPLLHFLEKGLVSLQNSVNQSF